MIYIYTLFDIYFHYAEISGVDGEPALRVASAEFVQDQRTGHNNSHSEQKQRFIKKAH